MKTNLLRNIYVMFIFTMSMVMGLSFTACSEYDGPDSPDTPIVPEKPDVTLTGVDKLGCEAVSTTWSAENVTLTKASYTAAERQGAAFAVTSVKYTAELKYSDNSVKESSQNFSYNNTANLFWGNSDIYVNSLDILKSTPTTSTQSGVKFFSWGETYTCAALVEQSASVSSLSFNGFQKTDLCSFPMSLSFVSNNITDLDIEKDGWHKYNMTITLKGEVAEDYRNITFGPKTVWVKTQGGDIPDKDPEFVTYEYKNGGFDYLTPTTGRSHEEQYAIYSDGTSKLVKKIETICNNYHKVPSKQTYIVNSFNYTSNKAVSYNMVLDGTSRISNENSSIFLKGYQNTFKTSTNVFACLFEGHFEIPTFTDEFGASHVMPYREYEFSDNGIIKGNEFTEGTYQILPLSSNTTAYFCSKNYTLVADIDLKKVKGGDIPNELTGITVTVTNIDNYYIYFDVTRYYTVSTPSSESLKVRHMATQTAEDRKNTTNRNYGFSSTKVDTLSSASFIDGRCSGRLVKFAKTFRYNQFDNIITNELRTDIIYTEGKFSAPLNAGNSFCDKLGHTLGTQNLGNGTTNIYDDNINYGLTLGGYNVANSTQVVRYSESVEDVVTFNIVNVRPTAEGKLLYDLVENHSVNTASNKTTTFSKDMNPSLDAKAVSAITSTTSGITIAGDSNFEYTEAKDYSFTFNKFIENVYAAVTYKFTVTHNGQTFNVAANGASVRFTSISNAKTSEDANYTYYNYTISYDLYVESVKVASDSEVVTLKVKKEAKDEVSYEVKNVRPMSDGKLYYDYVETHTVNTSSNKTTTYSKDMMPSITARNISDFISTTAGISLNGSSSLNYIGASDYTFAFNKFNGIANASVTYSFNVNHDKVYTVAANGASVKVAYSNAEVTSDASYTYYTYTITYDLYVENVKVATTGTTAVEKVAKQIFKTTYEFVNASYVLTRDAKAAHKFIVLKASGEKSGYLLRNLDTNEDTFVAMSTVTANNGINSAVINDNGNLIPAVVTVYTNSMEWVGKNTQGDKTVGILKTEALIIGMKNYGKADDNRSVSPLLTAETTTKVDGQMTITVHTKDINGKTTSTTTSVVADEK